MLGDRMRLARNLLGMTLNELTDLYNKEFNPKLNKGSFSKFENGKQYPSLKVINNLSKILDVSVDFLLERTNFTLPYDNLNVKNTYDIRQITRERLVLLGEIECGERMFSKSNSDYIEIGTPIEADFCLVVRGDSMQNARMYDGDIVFVKRQSEIENGEIAVVAIENIATLKRVYITNNDIILKSENPKYESMCYPKNSDKFRILGKVIAFRSKVI